LSAAIMATVPILGIAHEHAGESTFWFGHVGDAAATVRTIKLSATDLKFTPMQMTVVPVKP